MAVESERSKTAVARRLAHHGLSAANRSQTMAATTAKVADANARCAALELSLLDDGARLRQQLYVGTRCPATVSMRAHVLPGSRRRAG